MILELSSNVLSPVEKGDENKKPGNKYVWGRFEERCRSLVAKSVGVAEIGTHVIGSSIQDAVTHLQDVGPMLNGLHPIQAEATRALISSVSKGGSIAKVFYSDRGQGMEGR